MGTQTRITDKKLWQQAKIPKQNIKIYSDKTEKEQQLEWKIKLEKTKQKIPAKEGRIKRYLDKTKQFTQNRTFQNNDRKFYQQAVGEWAKTYKQPNVKEARFWSKTWEWKDHNKKAEWMNSMETELWTLEEGPLVNIHSDALKWTLKKYQTGKPLA